MPGAGQSAAVVLAANAVCLLLIVLAVAIWRAREPMAPPKLRRTLRRRLQGQSDVPPFNGSLSMTLCVMDDLELPAGESALVRALLIRWVQSGRVCIRTTAKRKLESFGADLQATLVFTDSAAVPPEGAEGLLFDTLQGWAGEDGALQESTLYNFARAQAAVVRSRLMQFWAEGKHALRARGAAFPEPKKRRFGFLDERRTIYTERGVREAGALLDYRAYLQAQSERDGADAVFAALFGMDGAPEKPQTDSLAVLTAALLDGMHAGENAAH